jgi:hypothetical protein
MVNRAAGEIYKTSSILAQTFGETVATAFGLVFYQKSDGKLYRALANAAATVAGKLFVCLDAATVKDRPGNVLAQGLVEKTGWSWAVGGLVYVSPTSPGGLTQTVPTGTQKIRPVGFATKTDQIDFRPLWGTGATYEVNFPDIPASHGDILVRSANAWGAVPGTTIGVHPLVPDLPNRVLRIKDGASTPNDLEIHQVWIPFFRSAGLTQPNLNNLLLGGFWVDKFQACMPLATATSRGGLTPEQPRRRRRRREQTPRRPLDGRLVEHRPGRHREPWRRREQVRLRHPDPLHDVRDRRPPEGRVPRRQY